MSFQFIKKKNSLNVLEFLSCYLLMAETMEKLCVSYTKTQGDITNYRCKYVNKDITLLKLVHFIGVVTRCGIFFILNENHTHFEVYLSFIWKEKKEETSSLLLSYFIFYSIYDSYLVDPASSHMLVSKIKPCMSKYKLFIR